MHPRSYCPGVLAIEMKNKIPSLSSAMMLIYAIYDASLFFYFSSLFQAQGFPT